MQSKFQWVWDGYQFAEIAKSLVPLAWPGVVVYFLFTFRTQISYLLNNAEVTFGGNKVTVKRMVTDLRHSLEDAKDDQESNSPANPQVQEAGGAHGYDPAINVQPATLRGHDPEINEIVEIATENKVQAILALSAKIKRHLNQSLSERGFVEGRTTLNALAHRMVAAGYPASIADSVKQFSQLRNRLVNGGRANETELKEILDLGLELYSVLRLV